MKQLRPYQEECNDAVEAAYKRGVKRCLNVMATGLGKTLTTIKMIDRMGFKRVLWLSDRENLISQSGIAFLREKCGDAFADKAKEMGFVEWVAQDGTIYQENNTFTIGAIKADIWAPSCDVVMGSLQTIHRRLDRLDPDHFDLIVADEAHNYCSNSAVKTLNYFQPKLLLGLTATPYRLDGLSLSDIFEEIVYEYDILKGIQNGYLCELEGIRIKTNISLDKVHTLGGEFNQSELVQEVNTPERNKLIVESFIKYCGSRQAIGYAVNIKHAVDLAEIFNEYGIKSVAISSNEDLTPDSQKKLGDYGNGKYQVIWNVAMIVAGYDAPETGVIIQAAPTKSLTKYLQSVGRGTRLKSPEYVSKYGQKAIVLDIIDNTTKHSLVNTWSLDKGKKTEERVFTTREQKDATLAAIEARKATILANRNVDEKVNLLQLPKVEISKSWKMSEDATPAQLQILRQWNYPIEDNHYTKAMVSEIFNQQPASHKTVSWLKFKGYDVEGRFVSVAEAQLASKEILQRESKRK